MPSAVRTVTTLGESRATTSAAEGTPNGAAGAVGAGGAAGGCSGAGVVHPASRTPASAIPAAARPVRMRTQGAFPQGAGLTREVGRRISPAPARGRVVRGRIGARRGVGLGDAGAPLDVRNEGGPELGIVGQAGLVGALGDEL